MRVSLVNQDPFHGREASREVVNERALIGLEPPELLLDRGLPDEQASEDGEGEPDLFPRGHRPHEAGEDGPGIEVEEREAGAKVLRRRRRSDHLRPRLGPVLGGDPPLYEREDRVHAEGGSPRWRGLQGLESGGVELDSIGPKCTRLLGF